MAAPSGGRRCALDRADDAQMRAAAAKVVHERRLDLVLARLRIRLEERRSLHDHAVDAIAALHGLLVDERLLQPMRLLGRTETLERYDLAALDGGDRHDARAHR